MSKGTMSFAKGMAAGMAAGAIAATVGRAVITNSHKITKGSAKVVRAMGDFVNGIQTIIK